MRRAVGLRLYWLALRVLGSRVEIEYERCDDLARLGAEETETVQGKDL